jgi:hypothetical protein
MTDISEIKAAAYLYYVAENPVSENFTNEDFILSLAIAYRTGFVTGFDWDTEIGENLREYIATVWPRFQEWLDENEAGAMDEITLAEENPLP